MLHLSKMSYLLEFRDHLAQLTVITMSLRCLLQQIGQNAFTLNHMLNLKQ